MQHNKYTWERLSGHIESSEGWNVRIDERRRKANECKLTAKGKSKGAKIARCQSIADALPEQFMNIAKRANRADRQREERRAKRAK